MPLNLLDQIICVSDVYITELNESAVALNLNNESYYGLNKEAFKMYQALVNSSNIEAALLKLASEFPISREELESDIMELIQELLENGLVTIKSEHLE